MSKVDGISRRTFTKGSIAAGTIISNFSILNSAQAQGKEFKVALIGCGGRGTGALANHLDAAEHLGIKIKVVATADAFQEKANNTGKKYNTPEDKCFGGYDAYKKIMETDAEIVIIATPPAFRPLHTEAAVKAGKHLFIEKPVAIDPPGARRIIAAGEEAKKKGLAIVAGTQRRHQAAYLKNACAIKEGAIGQIVGGTIHWCGGALWYKERNAGEDDASYMTRNWTSFAEMSGDHIVEQHVHNIDVANWFIGRLPKAALGFGERARRKTGDQFDFFSIDFDYGDGCNIHSMCRQINGCYNRVSEFFVGTEGVTAGSGGMKPFSGKEVKTPDFEEHKGPYCQEHIDLLKSIVAGTPLNEAENVGTSTMCALMGRTAAYTGKLVRWVDLMENKDSEFYNLTLSPTAEDFEKGTVKAPQDEVAPKPGKDKE